MAWKDVLVVWLFLSTARISKCINHGKLFETLSTFWLNGIKIEPSVDDAQIQELKEMIQKLSVEVKNNRADIDILLNQPGKL